MICYRGLFASHRFSQTIKALTLWFSEVCFSIASIMLLLLAQKIHAGKLNGSGWLLLKNNDENNAHSKIRGELMTSSWFWQSCRVVGFALGPQKYSLRELSRLTDVKFKSQFILRFTPNSKKKLLSNIFFCRKILTQCKPRLLAENDWRKRRIFVGVQLTTFSNLTKLFRRVNHRQAYIITTKVFFKNRRHHTFWGLMLSIFN